MARTVKYKKPCTKHRLDLMFEHPKGEGYIFRAIDFGDFGLKVELVDPRDLDLLDKDRIHAVLIDKSTAGELRRWLNQNMPY